MATRWELPNQCRFGRRQTRVPDPAATAALIDRGVPPHAAHTGVTVFHVAFARWVRQDDPATLNHLIKDSLAKLRAVIAT